MARGIIKLGNLAKPWYVSCLHNQGRVLFLLVLVILFFLFSVNLAQAGVDQSDSLVSNGNGNQGKGSSSDTSKNDNSSEKPSDDKNTNDKNENNEKKEGNGNSNQGNKSEDVNGNNSSNNNEGKNNQENKGSENGSGPSPRPACTQNSDCAHFADILNCFDGVCANGTCIRKPMCPLSYTCQSGNCILPDSPAVNNSGSENKQPETKSEEDEDLNENIYDGKPDKEIEDLDVKESDIGKGNGKSDDKGVPDKSDTKPTEDISGGHEEPPVSSDPSVVNPITNESPQQEGVSNENESNVSQEICSCNVIEKEDLTNEDEITENCAEFCANINVESSAGSTLVNEIPRGSIVALDAKFLLEKSKLREDEININQEVRSISLLDAVGHKYDVGITLFLSSFWSLPEDYKLLNSSKIELTNLVALIKIPEEVSEGDAVVSILGNGENLVSIPLKVTSSKSVKIGKRKLGKPQIKEPISASLVSVSDEKNMRLVMKIKGRNFVGRTAIIDDSLQKLINKAQFFTNIIFAPSSGIEIKKIKVINTREITLTADISKDITPGAKFFNVITPSGTDIGAIIIPSNLNEGILEATTDIESFIVGARLFYLNNNSLVELMNEL